MIQISLGTATRRLTMSDRLSRHIYVIKLSLRLRSTLSHQEVSDSILLHFSPSKSMGSLCPFLLLSMDSNRARGSDIIVDAAPLQLPQAGVEATASSSYKAHEGTSLLANSSNSVMEIAEVAIDSNDMPVVKEPELSSEQVHSKDAHEADSPEDGKQTQSEVGLSDIKITTDESSGPSQGDNASQEDLRPQTEDFDKDDEELYDGNDVMDSENTSEAKTVSVMEGETVTLNTDGTEIHRDDLIEWRFGDENSLIAEIKGTGEISTYDGRFRGRLELDKKTGTLTITNTRTADSGDYQLLIRSSSGESSKKIRVHVMIPKISVNVGNDVTLNTDAEIQTDDLILWTFGAKNAVIAYMTGQTGGKHVPDERFRDRLEVDKKTGSLTITNMRNEQSGDYQLQIGSSRGTLYKKFRVCVVYRSDGKAPPSPRSSSLKALKSGSDGKAPPSPRSSPLKAQKSVIPESTTVEVDTPLLSGMVEVNEQQETSSL